MGVVGGGRFLMSEAPLQAVRVLVKGSLEKATRHVPKSIIGCLPEETPHKSAIWHVLARISGDCVSPLEIARHPILKVTFKRFALPLEPF